MDLSWHALTSLLQVKTITVKSKDLATLAFKNNSRHTHNQPTEAEPSFRKVSLQNYVCFSLLTSVLESLATNLLPLTGPGLRPTVQNSS